MVNYILYSTIDNFISKLYVINDSQRGGACMGRGRVAICLLIIHVWTPIVNLHYIYVPPFLFSATELQHEIKQSQERSPDLQCWEMRWFSQDIQCKNRKYPLFLQYKITILFVPLPIFGKIGQFVMHVMLMGYSCEIYTMFTMYQEEGNCNDCIMGSNSMFIIKTKSLQP